MSTVPISPPRHERREGIFTNNQFGPLQVNTIREHELCIPTSYTMP